MLSIVTTTTYWKSHEVTGLGSGEGVLLLQPALKYLSIILGVGIFFLVLGLMMSISKNKIQSRSIST